MRRLCFGGSFNPIHHGHLICARAVAEAAGFEQVVLIPSAQPPHKPDSTQIAPAEHRLAMCRLAVDGVAGFEVSDVEVGRGGASYTLDTARELKARGWGSVQWLIGADMLMFLPQWHQPQALLEEVEFIVMARPGWSIDFDALPPEFRHLRQNVVTAPLVEISSTDIRKRCASGLAVDYLVPPPVTDYITRHALYQSK